MTDRRTGAGFTLVEMLVSITIIGFIVLVIIQAFLTTIRTNAKSEALRDIKQNGDYAMNTLVRMIQNAQSIDNYTGSSLTITNPDGLQTTFQADSASCKIASISSYAPAQPYFLTSGNVVLSPNPCALSISVTTLYGKPARVTVSFTLKQSKSVAGSFEAADMTFRTTTEVRNIDL